jgi:hypothetical protein
MLLSTNPATKHFVGESFADKVVRGEIVFEKKKEKDRVVTTSS